MFSTIALFAESSGLAFSVEKAEFNALACLEFDKNPTKSIFGKTIYCTIGKKTISNEILRQRDKSNSKVIDYFQRRIIQYVTNCHVPPNCEEGG